MYAWRLTLVILAVVMVPVGLVRGDVVVERICDSTGIVEGVSTWASGQTVYINPTQIFPLCAPSRRATFRVRSTNPSMESIGPIVFQGSPGTVDYVKSLLIGPSFAIQTSTVGDFGAVACVDWGGLDPGNYSVRLQAQIGGDLLGPVTAANVVRLRIGGSVTAAGDIRQTDDIDQLHAVRAAGSIAGDVIAEGGDIRFVQSDSGNISSIVSATGGTVVQVRADTGVLSGTISSNRGQIALVKARNIAGTIMANGQLQSSNEYYAIDRVEATEDIGTWAVDPQTQLPTSVSPATITTDAGPRDGSTSADPGYYNGGIKFISARNIFANISTPVPVEDPRPPYSATNKRGDIRELVTTGTTPGNGKVVGTISTFTFGETVAPPAFKTIDIRGDLEATVNVAGTIKNLVQISGNVTSGASLVLLEQDLTARGDITITGTLAGTVSVDGNKLGDLKILPGSMTGLIHIGGDLRSRLTIGGTIAPTALIAIDGDVDPVFSSSTQLDSITFAGASAMAGRLWIGGSLHGYVLIPPPPPFGGGLSGQVIINQNGTTGNFNGTTGRVRIGQVGTPGWLNIASPYYPLKSSDIGGGAVGLAPFALHREDCVPTHLGDAMDRSRPALLTSSFLDARPAGAPEGRIRIRSYGPLRVVSTPAVRIEVQDPDPDHPCAWHPADSFFTVTLFPDGNKRLIELTRVSTGVPYAGVYRVVSQGLVCDEVEGDPALAWPTEYLGSDGDPAYTFWVGADCGGPVETDGPNGRWDILDINGDPSATPPVPACGTCDISPTNGVLDWCQIDPGDTCQCDWNGTGIVSVQDLFDFLQCFFAGDADFNGSGTTTVQDIFDFLNCFFTKPHPCRGL